MELSPTPDSISSPRKALSVVRYHWLRRYLLLWALFFLMCAGLGYPSLNRYRPPATEGLSDTAVYYQMVTQGTPSVAHPYMRGRILIPFVARPFYWFARGRVISWDPVAFALLVSNSIFCALGSCLLVSIGQRVSGNLLIGLLAATLHLLSFAVPNLQLAGLVDSGESCFLLAVIYSLLASKWSLLPVWGVFGTLAKETFVPLALVFTAVWWLSSSHTSGDRTRSSILWTVMLALASLVTLILLHTIINGQVVWPWQIAVQAHAGSPFLSALLGSLLDRGFWYVFIWLLPLGLFNLHRLPRPWLWASLITALVALGLGAWKDMQGTVARPLFDVIGPLLSLSTAMLLSGSNERNALNSLPS
jgi:hypothetical protein